MAVAIAAAVGVPDGVALAIRVGAGVSRRRTVAAAVKSMASGTPVILLTGWGYRLKAENDLPQHVDRVLGKPPKMRTGR